MSVIVHRCACGHPACMHGLKYRLSATTVVSPCPAAGCPCVSPVPMPDDVMVLATLGLDDPIHEPGTTPHPWGGGPGAKVRGLSDDGARTCPCGACRALYASVMAGAA